MRAISYAEAANLAVNQTLMRSINTSLISLLPVGGLLFVGAGLLGVGTLKDLALVLFVGLAAGAYSSLFLATPWLVDLKEREPRYAALKQRVAAKRAAALKGEAPAGAESLADAAGQPEVATAGAGVGGSRPTVAAAQADGHQGRSAQRQAEALTSDAVNPAPANGVDQTRSAPDAGAVVPGADDRRGRRGGRAHPGHPRLPEAGHPVQGPHPAVRGRPGVPTAVDAIIARYTDGDQLGFDTVVGIEARGFVLAAAIGYAAGIGLVPVRKAGKLPGKTHSVSYALEYGEATLEVHTDAFRPGSRVLVVDDVLATGGTVEATLELVRRAGAEVVGVAVVLELGFLGGRERLAPQEIHALSTV